jgi:hypothetical protein
MQTLDKHFRSLTGTIFQKHGFAQADVLSHWRDIMGVELANLCMPERIRWPKAGDLSGGRGATLSVKAHAGEALTVQHAVPQMLERLNGFLGHGAITKIKITPGHSPRKPATPAKPDLPPSPRLLTSLAQIADQGLQAALLRLGTAVGGKSPRSPQVK